MVVPPVESRYVSQIPPPTTDRFLPRFIACRRVRLTPYHRHTKRQHAPKRPHASCSIECPLSFRAAAARPTKWTPCRGIRAGHHAVCNNKSAHRTWRSVDDRLQRCGLRDVHVCRHGEEASTCGQLEQPFISSLVIRNHQLHE